MGQVRRLDEARPVSRVRAKTDPEAAAANRLAKAIDRAVDRFGPAADTIVGFGHRLDKLCAWLKKWGPWLLGSAPFVLTAVNGASPELAKMLASIVKAWAG